MAAKAMKAKGTDRRFVLWLAGAVVAAVLLFALFGPRADTDDPEPTSYNASARGLKAAFLLLPRLGYGVDRWTEPATHLDRLDAARTTLVITNPDLPFRDLELVQKALEQFMQRGGRVIATGETGARLLPGGTVGAPDRRAQAVLRDHRRGRRPARPAAGRAHGRAFALDHRGPALPRAPALRQGRGRRRIPRRPRPGHLVGAADAHDQPRAQAGPQPRARAGKHRAGQRGRRRRHPHRALRRVAARRTRNRGQRARRPALVAAYLAAGRGGRAACAQLGRRNGPLRMPATITRTSPVEFAQSMGRLYEKAGATEAATGAAESRLKQYLHQSGGLTRETLRSSPETVGEALRSRFGGDWAQLEADLRYAADSEAAGGQIPHERQGRLEARAAARGRPAAGGRGHRVRSCTKEQRSIEGRNDG